MLNATKKDAYPYVQYSATVSSALQYILLPIKKEVRYKNVTEADVHDTCG